MKARWRFLVLQDDDDARFLSCRALRKAFCGCAVCEAISCAEALGQAKAHAFDAILADHHLAEEDGAEFVHALDQEGAHCPVIMVTCHDNPEIHRRAYAAGAAHVFHPGDMDFVGYLRETLAPADGSPP